MKRYLRSLVVSGIISFSAVLCFYGICKAFEGIKLISSGEKLSAVEIIYGADSSFQGVRILDFEIN